MCYVVGEGELSWADARAWCKHNDSKADLVSIHSPLENDQVIEIIIIIMINIIMSGVGSDA